MASGSGSQASPSGGIWEAITGRQQAPGSSAEFAEWTNTDRWTGEYVDRLQETQHSQAGTSSDPSSGKSGKKLSRWQRMTPQQRENNKKLQRDYRDRKKARNEANEAIVKVSGQLQNAQLLKSESDNLEAANRQLREALKAREAEIARVKKELATKTTAAAYEASQPGNVLTKLFRPDVEKAFAIKCSQFENQVGILRELLERSGVPPSCREAPADAEVAATLNYRIKETMAACMHCLGLSGPNLDQLIEGASQGIEVHSSMKRHYLEIVKQLHLSPAQMEGSRAYLQGLEANLRRETWLGRQATLCERLGGGLPMRELRGFLLEEALEPSWETTLLSGIYEARHSLNQEVLHLLTPTPDSQLTASGEVAPDPTFPARLRASIQELQGNLGEEQRLESETHYVTFHSILSPCQGGWLIVLAAPDHCNVRAFLTAVREEANTMIAVE